MTDFKTCPHCGKSSGRDSMGRAMMLCGSEPCKRAAAAARSRKARAKRNAPPIPVPQAPKVVIETPWGTQVSCVCVAWAESQILSGFEGNRAEAAVWLEDQGYDGHGSNACPALRASA